MKTQAQALRARGLEKDAAANTILALMKSSGKLINVDQVTITSLAMVP